MRQYTFLFIYMNVVLFTKFQQECHRGTDSRLDQQTELRHVDLPLGIFSFRDYLIVVFVIHLLMRAAVGLLTLLIRVLFPFVSEVLGARTRNVSRTIIDKILASTCK